MATIYIVQGVRCKESMQLEEILRESEVGIIQERNRGDCRRSAITALYRQISERRPPPLRDYEGETVDLGEDGRKGGLITTYLGKKPRL